MPIVLAGMLSRVQEGLENDELLAWIILRRRYGDGTLTTFLCGLAQPSSLHPTFCTRCLRCVGYVCTAYTMCRRCLAAPDWLHMKCLTVEMGWSPDPLY